MLAAESGEHKSDLNLPDTAASKSPDLPEPVLPVKLEDITDCLRRVEGRIVSGGQRIEGFKDRTL